MPEGKAIHNEHKEKGAQKVWNLVDLGLYECPLTYITTETHEIVRQLYRTEDTKRLLFQGDWTDQPVWFVEAYDVFKEEQAHELRREEDGGTRGS